MLDFTKLPKGLIIFLINIFIFPFCFFSMYLFSNELYKTGDFLIMGSLCISLTIISFFLSALIIFDSENKDDELLSQNIVMPSVLLQSLLLSVLIFIFYLLRVILSINISFFIFLCFYFGLLIGFIIIQHIYIKFKKPKK
jgi:hypothetical protein